MWIYNLIYGSKNKEIDNLKIENETLRRKLEELMTKSLEYPKSYGKITLKEELSILGPLTSNIQITDEYLNVTTMNEAKKFSNDTKVANRVWVKEDHDCDNFAAALWGYYNTGLWSYAFGYARSNSHAFNIMIDNDKKIWIVEPQTNEYMNLEEAKKKSTPDGLNYWPITFIQM